MSNERQVVQGEHGGVSYEVSWNVERNTKGFNRESSVRLFFPGTADSAEDARRLHAAGSVANSVVFEKMNAMENNERMAAGAPVLMDVTTGETE